VFSYKFFISKIGSVRSLLSKYDYDDNSIIRLYPAWFKAIKGNKPILSSNLKFICVPIIGCVPDLDIFSENSKAPHKFAVSERPIDCILLLLH